MKTEKELIALARDWDSAYMEDSTVVNVDGSYYPLSMGQLVNPLDPVNLIYCMPGNDEPDHPSIPHVLKIFDTLFAAQGLRTAGYAIVSRKDSGAPTVIKERNGFVNVLGDYAKVFKGMRMGGQMGGDRVTTQNLKVLKRLLMHMA